MSWNGTLRVIGGTGAIAAFAGLFATFAVTTAAYPALDALFVGGATASLASVALVK